jgi:hypothetical protein
MLNYLSASKVKGWLNIQLIILGADSHININENLHSLTRRRIKICLNIWCDVASWNIFKCGL